MNESTAQIQLIQIMRDTFLEESSHEHVVFTPQAILKYLLKLERGINVEKNIYIMLSEVKNDRSNT